MISVEERLSGRLRFIGKVRKADDVNRAYRSLIVTVRSLALNFHHLVLARVLYPLSSPCWSQAQRGKDGFTHCLATAAIRARRRFQLRGMSATSAGFRDSLLRIGRFDLGVARIKRSDVRGRCVAARTKKTGKRRMPRRTRHREKGENAMANDQEPGS